MRKSLLVILLFLSAGKARANFDFNANCVQAYKDIVSLKLPAARALIDREKAQHPKNSITVLLDNYYDCFKVLAGENKAEFDRIKDRRSQRLNALDDEDESSPYCNFARAEINLQWAVMHSTFGEFSTAGLCIKRALGQLQTNRQRFPGFLPNEIPLGVVNVMLDAIPDGPFKSILAFFGIKGSISTGMGMLQNLTVKLPASGYAMYNDELVFYITYLQGDVLNDPSAYAKMQQYTIRVGDSSLLKSYIQGHTALRTGHSAEAVTYFQHRPTSNEYQPYPLLNYMEGVARLNVMDDNAINYFNKFLREGKSDNYIKDTYLHLAWIGLLQGDTKRYQAFAQLVKTKGNTYIDRDKQAVTEVNQGTPDKTLLKARLYNDGGLNAQAEALLQHTSAAAFSNPHDKIEYAYRLGRVEEALGNDKPALDSYQQAINSGRNTAYYFTAAAALRAGGIYERHKDASHAASYYNIAVSCKNTDISASYIQKARLGLKRLNR